MVKLFSILLLIPFVAFSQEREYVFECDFEIQNINDSIYSIQVINFDSLHLGETCFLGWMNTGQNKPNGTLIVFDENMTKRQTAHYQDGIRVGTYLMWYSTGELKSETTWETDMYFTSTSYYKSGQIETTAENGNRENAVYSFFYENGQIESILEGPEIGHRTWFENGQLKSYQDNRTSTYTTWHQNGNVKMKGNLIYNFIRTGTWKYYDESGRLKRELTYDDYSEADIYNNESGYTHETRH